MAHASMSAGAARIREAAATGAARRRTRRPRAWSACCTRSSWRCSRRTRARSRAPAAAAGHAALAAAGAAPSGRRHAAPLGWWAPASFEPEPIHKPTLHQIGWWAAAGEQIRSTSITSRLPNSFMAWNMLPEVRGACVHGWLAGMETTMLC